MKIRTIKQLKYKNCPILIRRLGRFTFEYLLIYQNKFYGTHIKDKLHWWQYYKIFMEEPYTNKQLNAFIHFITKAAETTIITLKHKKNVGSKQAGRSKDSGN